MQVSGKFDKKNCQRKSSPNWLQNKNMWESKKEDWKETKNLNS